MSIISKLEAHEILDSRGNPTVLVSCVLENGASAIASVPSGVSTGENEAYELRDNDPDRFAGKGVLKAVENINKEISKFLLGKELNQDSLDSLLVDLDGTKNKHRLGANAILAVSLAFARAVSVEKGIPLYKHLADLYFKNEDSRKYKIPQPSFNMIEGGKHSDSGLSVQEFMMLPVGFDDIKTKIEVAEKLVSSLRNILLENGEVISMGDEGGFAPKLSSTEKALEYLEKSVVSAGYSMNQVSIGLDVAATTFYKDIRYAFDGKNLTTDELISAYEELCSKHKIISIEDGLSQKDFAGFAELNRRLGGSINIVGDDLTVTNVVLIKEAIENKSINTLLIKPNQIGTVSETFNAIRLAKENNIKIFVSHRGGETEDTFIADLAVAVGADFIKAGDPTKKERIVKYDRLIEIEKELSDL